MCCPLVPTTCATLPHTDDRDSLSSSYHAYLLLSKGVPKAGGGASVGPGATAVMGSTMVLQTGEELLEVTEG